MQVDLAAVSKELETAVEKAAPAVVAIEARRHMTSSGFYWRPGVIVTAEHTLRRDEEIRITDAGGRTTSATLAGRDSGTDLAVLKVAENGGGSVLPLSSGGYKPGHVVLSLGRSRDSGINASMGILSAVSPSWRTWRGGNLDQYLRLDLTLFPGSDGGPVITPDGAVIGVSTAALSRVAPLAIPASTVNRIVDQILTRGHVARGYLGVGLQAVPLPEHMVRDLGLKHSSGAMVLSVEPGGPAGVAGISMGDILTGIGPENVADSRDVQSALAGDLIGKPVEVKIIRGGALTTKTVVIGERPGRGD